MAHKHEDKFGACPDMGDNCNNGSVITQIMFQKMIAIFQKNIRNFPISWMMESNLRLRSSNQPTMKIIGKLVVWMP